MKKTIKLTESDLRNIISEAINEIGDTPAGQEFLMRMKGKNAARMYRSNLTQKEKEHNANLNTKLSDEMYDNGNDTIGRGLGNLNYNPYYISGFNDEASKLSEAITRVIAKYFR